MAPLALMVVLTGLYASIESKKIDIRYSELLDQDDLTLQKLTEAKAQVAFWGQLLYEQTAELDSDKVRVIEGELDNTSAEYHSLIADSVRQSPNLAKEIKAAAAPFDQVLSDSHPVRAATLSGDSTKSMNLMRGGMDTELLRARKAMADIVEQMRKSVDQQSDDLTNETHHAILVSWLLMGFGLAGCFAIALYILGTRNGALGNTAKPDVR